MYAEYTQLQLTFLALVPWIDLCQLHWLYSIGVLLTFFFLFLLNTFLSWYFLHSKLLCPIPLIEPTFLHFELWTFFFWLKIPKQFYLAFLTTIYIYFLSTFLQFGIFSSLLSIYQLFFSFSWNSIPLNVISCIFNHFVPRYPCWCVIHFHNIPAFYQNPLSSFLKFNSIDVMYFLLFFSDKIQFILDFHICICFLLIIFP